MICVIMVPVFCFVIAPLLIYGIGHFWSSTEKVYEVNWNITLPDDMDLLDDRSSLLSGMYRTIKKSLYFVYFFHTYPILKSGI